MRATTNAHPSTNPAAPGRASLDTQYRPLKRPTAKSANGGTPGGLSPYPCGLWTWRNDSTGDLQPFACQRWKCPRCSPALVDRWTRLLAAAKPQRHIVLTNLGPDNTAATTRLKAIIKGIRRGELRRPAQIDYFASLEGRNKPSIHAHLLAHGSSLPQRQLSALAARYGAGPVTWIRSIEHDPAPACHAYVLRHLVGVEHPTQQKSGRRVRYSRGFWHGQTRAAVAALLWPPGPHHWTLLKPDQAAREALADHRSRHLYNPAAAAADLKAYIDELTAEALDLPQQELL